MPALTPPRFQDVAASVLAAIVVAACVLILPQPKNSLVLLCALGIVVLGILCGLFGVRLPVLPIRGDAIRFNIRVLLPTIAVGITLSGISAINTQLAPYLTSDTVYVIAIAVFLLLLVSQFTRAADETVAVAATCVPISHDRPKGVYRVTLVCNPHYKQESWMFPGGHVHIHDGVYPPEVARSKTRVEAGLDVDLLSGAAVSDGAFDGMDQVAAPHFNFVFTLDESARCRKSDGHEYHYDFTYIGVVRPVPSRRPAYDTLEVEFNSPQISVDEAHAKLAAALEQHYKARQAKPPARPHPPSIPVILTKALAVLAAIENHNA